MDSRATYTEKIVPVFEELDAVHDDLEHVITAQADRQTEHAQATASSVERLTIAVLLAAIAFALGIAWWMARRLTRRMQATLRAVRGLAEGDTQQEIEVDGRDELADMGSTV